MTYRSTSRVSGTRCFVRSCFHENIQKDPCTWAVIKLFPLCMIHKNKLRVTGIRLMYFCSPWFHQDATFSQRPIHRTVHTHISINTQLISHLTWFIKCQPFYYEKQNNLSFYIIVKQKTGYHIPAGLTTTIINIAHYKPLQGFMINHNNNLTHV